MKYILSLLIVGFSWITTAQNNIDRTNMMKNFTPEQQAILKTKKMVLQLDLNSSQQNQILEINKKTSIERRQKMDAMKEMKKNGKTPSADERFNMMSSMLDTRIANQVKVKNILNNKQFELWKEMQNKEMNTMKRKYHKPKSKMNNKKT